MDISRRRATLPLLALIAASCLLAVTAGCTSSADNAVVAPTAAGLTPAPALPVEAATQHLDAHDGGILQVDAVFYEFGTSYDCGFQFGGAGHAQERLR